MSADHQTAMLDYACHLLDAGGVVLITGPIGTGRSTLLRRLADTTARSGAIVNTITVDDTTSTDSLTALCNLRGQVLAIDGLDHTDPIPALMTNDDGTAVLATCHALDAAGALDRLVSASLAQGLSDRAAIRLVRTHVDLILVTGRRAPTGVGEEFMITGASTVDDDTLVPVYVTTPHGDRLLLPDTGSSGGPR